MYWISKPIIMPLAGYYHLNSIIIIIIQRWEQVTHV